MKKPEVDSTCKGPGAFPVLTCKHGGRKELDVIWHRNGKKVVPQKDKTLILTSDIFKDGDEYSCTVNNQVSDQVQPRCPGLYISMFVE